MSVLTSPLGARTLNEYALVIRDSLAADEDAATLEATLRAFDSAAANEAVKARLAQAIANANQTGQVKSSGQVVSSLTGAGTGYAVGEVFPVTGEGTGAYVRVLTVGGSGEILTIEYSMGVGYETTATVDDSSSVGGSSATFSTVISNDQKVLADAAASIAGA